MNVTFDRSRWNPYTETLVEELAGGMIRVDNPNGYSVYQVTDGTYKLILGSSSRDRREAAEMFVSQRDAAEMAE